MRWRPWSGQKRVGFGCLLERVDTPSTIQLVGGVLSGFCGEVGVGLGRHAGRRTSGHGRAEVVKESRRVSKEREGERNKSSKSQGDEDAW